MDAPATATPPEITLQLSRDIYYQIVHTLRRSLPLPITDTPEDEARRDRAAIAHVASLRPASPEEADAAAHYVAASAQSFDCQRLARRYHNDAELILKCTAQSASMMRQARSWLTLLQRLQAARDKRAADADASARTTADERTALAMMADALLQTPPQTEPASRAAPSPVTEAERYAVLHRKRAALIRRLGGLPEKLNVGSIAPEVVRALVTGTTPILRSLDTKAARPTALAARKGQDNRASREAHNAFSVASVALISVFSVRNLRFAATSTGGRPLTRLSDAG